MIKNLLLIAFLLLHTASFSQSQKLLVDKIIGKIDQHIVLQSELSNPIEPSIHHPTQTEACNRFKDLMLQKMLLVQAQKDSLFVAEETIEYELSNRIHYFMQLYGREGLEEITGSPITEMKDHYRAAIKNRLLAEKAYENITATAHVTPAEVRAYFNTLPEDSLRYYETRVQIKQIVLYPKKNAAYAAYQKEELMEYKRLVESGKVSFQQLIHLNTDNPHIKEVENLIHFNRNDRSIEPVVRSVVINLKEGQLSHPLKTKEGYCLIQLISRSGDDFTIKQLKKSTTYTEQALQAITARLDSIRSNIIAKTISFEQAVAAYSEEAESKFSAGSIMNQSGETRLQLSELPPAMLDVYKTLVPGAISQPLYFTDAANRKGAKILWLLAQDKAHIENLKDDYAAIAEKLLQKKKQKLLDDWYKYSINKYYAAIDHPYIDCLKQ